MKEPKKEDYGYIDGGLEEEGGWSLEGGEIAYYIALKNHKMNNQLSKINQFPITKAEIQVFSDKIIEALDSGEIAATDVLLRFKSMEKINEAVKSKLTEACINELSKFKEKEVTLQGSVFKIGEFGHRWIFDECGDTVWQKLKYAADSANKALKEREDFLKTIKGHLTSVDEDSGEIITIQEAIKKSTTSVTVNIK